jgi:rhamnulokinase
MLGWLERGKMHTKEIHRFPNGMTLKNGHLCWDFEALFREIKTGLLKCRELGKIPSCMGIDTWGVDFVLLDGNGKVLGDTVGYRTAAPKGSIKKWRS